MFFSTRERDTHARETDTSLSLLLPTMSRVQPQHTLARKINIRLMADEITIINKTQQQKQADELTIVIKRYEAT